LKEDNGLSGLDAAHEVSPNDGAVASLDTVQSSAVLVLWI
jgi:hypothetical protein